MELELISIIFNAFIAIRLVVSSIMCVYGYKWNKGLIALMSTYVGAAIGLILFVMLVEGDAGGGSIVVVPICAVGFAGLAYKNIALNHFLGGFLLVTKISFMLITKAYEYGMSEEIAWLFVLPIILGVIGGVAFSTKFTGYVVISCLAFWGAIDFVPNMFQLLNGTLFAMTGDFGYIFDPASFILSIFGIEIPSGGEVFFILLVTAGSFYFQKVRAEREGIDLTQKLVDDRNL